MIVKEMRNNVSHSDTCFLLSMDKTDYIYGTKRNSIVHNDLTRL